MAVFMAVNFFAAARAVLVLMDWNLPAFAEKEKGIRASRALSASGSFNVKRIAEMSKVENPNGAGTHLLYRPRFRLFGWEIPVDDRLDGIRPDLVAFG